jgi:MFS transporter, DHA2 family, multidrug resistance protein
LWDEPIRFPEGKLMPGFEGMATPGRYWSALAIWLALIMAVLDGAIANVALPTIARELSAAPAYSVWVVNGYQLAIVVSLLPLAALGEEIGYRRVFLGGIVAFTAGSAACALSRTLTMLIFMRVLQGLGAAGIMSVNGALLRYTYPNDQLGRGIGLNALVVSAAAALGPTIAAGILAIGPWEWLFAINVPIGFVAVFMGLRWLPTNPQDGKFDIVSTCLNVLTFGLGFTGIDALTRGGDVPFGCAELVLAGLAGVALIYRSNAQPRPLVPIDLLRSALFTMTVLTSIASFAAQMLAFVALPFYFQGVLHRSQVDTGLLMTPWPVAAGVAASFAGRLADKYSAAILSGLGLGFLAIGLAAIALLPKDASSFEISGLMAVCGLGFGFFQSPNNRTMLSSAPMDRSGAAGGMLATARLTGQTTGATIAAIALHFATHAETVAITIAALFAFAGGLASLSRLRFRDHRVATSDEQPIPDAP